jgi:hypothetical protein
MKDGKKKRLIFRSVADSKSYYKKHLKGNKEYSQFARHFMLATTR